MTAKDMLLWCIPLLGLAGCESEGGNVDAEGILQAPADDDDMNAHGPETGPPLTNTPRPAEAPNKTPNALLVAPVAQWKYYRQQSSCLSSYPRDTQKDLWTEPDYDEGPEWVSGRAELGYGDGDEQTVIPFGGNADKKCITQLFRHTLVLNDPKRPPTLYQSLIVKLLRDDGAAVYLNGERIIRDNLPSNFGINTVASSQVEGSAEDRFFEFTGITNNLVAGTNVLAVEVHQSSRTNPDVSFNLALLGRLNNPNQYSTAAFSSIEATIDESSPNAMLGGDDECKVDGMSGTDNSDDEDQVCLARWNLAGLPATATVLAAHLEAIIDNDSPDRYEVYQLATAWDEPDVTWNNTGLATDWVSGEFSPANFTSSTPITVVNSIGETLRFYELPPATVQSWISPNFRGIAFFNTENENGIDFDASGVGIELVVTYRNP